MDKLRKIKGKIAMLIQLGLTYDEQIMIALPQIFNFEDNEFMKKITDLPTYVSAVFDYLYQNLSKIRHQSTYHLIIKKILPTIWPLLLRRADPQKFPDHLKHLKNLLQLTPEHICFMIHYSKKYPEKYPEFCIKHTMDFFGKIKAKFDLLVDVVVGEECVESLVSVGMFCVSREVGMEENQFVQEEFRPSTMTSIMEKLLSHKSTINKLILEVDCDATFIKYLDTWMQTAGNNILTIFRCLKIIIVCQCLFEVKFKDQTESLKFSDPLFKIICKVAERLLNRLFSQNVKQKIVILDWILQGKVWVQSGDQLKNCLMHYLIPCYELHSKFKASSQDCSLAEKIEHDQNILIMKYLHKIKEKHFQNTSFRSKVPKSYLKINLGLIEAASSKQQTESNTSLVKNKTETLSLSKFGQSGFKNENMGVSNSDKLISSVIKYTENLELHKIFIICLALKQDLGSKQVIVEETDSQNKIVHYHKSSSFRRLFYYIFKCINQYDKIFAPNILSWETSKILCTFAPHFDTQPIKQLYRADLQDLDLIPSFDLCLQNISTNLLRNSVFYSLTTIYTIQSAHNRYNLSLSENNNRKLNGNKDEMIGRGIQKVFVEEEKSVFVDCLEELIKILTKKKQEIEYLREICLVQQKRILSSLFLNFVYYILTKKPTPKHPQKPTTSSTSTPTLQQTIQTVYSHYFSLQQPTKQQLPIIKILATAHKILQNWRRCTRRHLGPDLKLSDALYDGHQQEERRAEIYWGFVVGVGRSLGILDLFSRNFQRVNCIKESIYLMHQNCARAFPPKFTTQQANRVYSLYSRLETHLHTCYPHISHKLPPKSTQSLKQQPQPKPSHTSHLSHQSPHSPHSPPLSPKPRWHNTLKYLSENANLDNLTSTIFYASGQICYLEDVQEIDQVLNRVYVFSLFYQAVNLGDYMRLYTDINKCEDSQICLSVVSCLQQKIKSPTTPTKSPQTPTTTTTTKQLSTLIYTQKLRYNKYPQLLSQLQKIPPQTMTPQQARTAIILYSQTQQYHKVRLLFRALQDNKQDYREYRQELEFWNMEAGYKCMMFYPVDFIVRDLQAIVRYIEDQVNPDHVTQNSTTPMFQAFKFICQNYPSLTFEQEEKIIRLLNRYLKKVYSISNLKLSIEAIYFILRFILIQSTNSNELLQDPNILPYQTYKPTILEPHRPMLISIISEDQKKNKLICKILVKIATHDPKASSWWLYGLRSHCKITDKIDRLDRVIQGCGDRIYEELRKRMINLDNQFGWIDWLFAADQKAQLKAIPKDMVSPFTTDIILEKVMKISPLGHGKSKPFIIQFKASKKKNPITVYLIRKVISRNNIGFRAESATANFFKDSKLLNDSITYSIIHLSKYCLLVEYIKHISTLDHLMLDQINRNQVDKLQKILQLSKPNKVLGSVYDNQSLQINFRLHSFFTNPSGLINSWWNKYTKFLKTYAEWCFLGYIVGLGDRHTNNILVTEEGQIIHIDFEFIFDTGMSLPFPEWVPFRLSRGLLHQFSIIEPYGLIYSQFIKTAQKYRSRNRDVWLAQSHFSFFKKSNVSINKRAELNHRPYEQTLKIFQNATSDLLLRDMFKGWGSYK